MEINFNDTLLNRTDNNSNTGKKRLPNPDIKHKQISVNQPKFESNYAMTDDTERQGAINNDSREPDPTLR